MERRTKSTNWVVRWMDSKRQSHSAIRLFPKDAQPELIPAGDRAKEQTNKKLLQCLVNIFDK